MTQKHRWYRKEKSQAPQNMPFVIDLVFILIFGFLVLAALLSVYIVEIGVLFQRSEWGTSLFAVLSSILISYYFIIWGFLKIKDRTETKKEPKKIISKGFKFIGLTKPSSKDVIYLFLSMFAGTAFSIFSLYLMSNLSNGKLILSSVPEVSIILQNFIVTPFFEEMIYRGIYLSVFLNVLGKNYASAISGLALSSLTFGWIHPTMPFLKFLAGLFLGFVYLYRWKKNLTASIFAHLGANVVSTFVLVEVVLRS